MKTIGEPMKKLTIPEQHQLKIARRTLNMPDAMVGVMGGMTKEQASQIVSEHNPMNRTEYLNLSKNPEWPGHNR